MADKSNGIEFTQIQAAQINKDAKRSFLAIIFISLLFGGVTFFEGNGLGIFAVRVAVISTALLALATLDFYERAYKGKMVKAMQALKILVAVYIGFVVVQIPTYFAGLNP